MTPGAALLVALSLQTPAGSAAERASAKVRLEVRAPADCTSRTDLAARIAARSANIEVVDEAPISAHVDVAAPRGGSVTADLVLTSPGVEEPVRQVVARSCAEVADAVALIIAVTLDPNLRRRVTPGPAAVPERAAPPVVRAPKAPAESPVEARPEVPAASNPPPPAFAPPPASPSVPLRRELAISAAGQAMFGPAPSAMPGIAVYVMAGLDRDGAWAPAIVIGATHVWRADLAESGGAASFTLDAGSVDVCPLRLRWGRLTARPCASALLGRLTASGSNVAQPASAARPFGVAGATIGAGFGAPVEVTARLGIGVTLLRDAYEFATNVFYRAAPITISASIGVGVRWP
jgi:hypothetical protein